MTEATNTTTLTDSAFPTVEAIRELVTLGQSAQSHELSIQHPAAEPADVYLMFDDRTGALSRHIAQPKPLTIGLASTVSLLALGDAILGPVLIGDETVGPPPPSSPFDPAARIYYNRAQIQLVWNTDDGRRHIATMPLPFQEQFQVLQGLAKREFNQRDFSVLLRTTFRHSMSADLIAAIRTLKWAIGAGEDSTVVPGRESVSRHVAAEVRGELAIPDEYSLQVGVYDTLETRFRQYAVLCAIDINQATKSFRLIPVANALESAIDAALSDLVAHLTIQTRIPVLFGQAQ